MTARENGPEPRGGLLADDQGLGKTVTTISLILTANHSLHDSSAGARRGGPGGSQVRSGRVVEQRPWTDDLHTFSRTRRCVGGAHAGLPVSGVSDAAR